jgi:hypothetical protein
VRHASRQCARPAATTHVTTLRAVKLTAGAENKA